MILLMKIIKAAYRGLCSRILISRFLFCHYFHSVHILSLISIKSQSKGDTVMQIDSKMLNRLLAMNDEQLGKMIQKIAAESGIDPAELGINPQSIESVRSALGSIGDDELEGINRLYEDYRKGKHNQL